MTPESGAAKTYTITVTRAAAPPAPTDCPADTDWCTTLGVGYATASTASFEIEYWGYQSDRSYGDLLSTTFSHGGTSYTVSQVSRTKLTQLPGNTVASDNLTLTISPALPDGTVLQLGSRTFTVDTDSDTNTIGQEQWGILEQPAELDGGPARHGEPEVSHRAQPADRPHRHRERCDPDRPRLGRPHRQRRRHHQRLQDRGLRRRRHHLDQPSRQHRHHQRHLFPHRPHPRQHPPLPRLRHQRQWHRRRLRPHQRHDRHPHATHAPRDHSSQRLEFDPDRA